MALSQMNVRIDERIRVEGNLALESIGLTPARTVRDVWSFAARNRNNPAKLRRAFRFLEQPETVADEVNPRLKAAQAAWRVADEAFADLGIAIEDAVPIPLDELKEQVYRERWEERGLL